MAFWKRSRVACVAILAAATGWYCYASRWLTADQTVGLVVADRHLIDASACAKANPSARHQIYAILCNQEFQEIHPRGYQLLGYIGDERDVAVLADFVDSKRSRTLNQLEQRKLSTVVHALGVLARRNVLGARAELSRISDASYAKGIRLAYNEDHDLTKVGGLTSQLGFLAWCLKARACSGDSITDDVTSVLSGISEEPLRSVMARRVSSARFWEIRLETRVREHLPISDAVRKGFEREFQGYSNRQLLAVNQFGGGDNENTYLEIQNLIDAGNSSVVPELRRYFTEELDKPAEHRSSRFSIAIAGLSAFHDGQSLGLVKLVYEDTAATVYDRSTAAIYLSRIATADDVTLLQQIMWDQVLSMPARCEAAKALWRLGDASGGEFLLEQYDLYRLELRSRPHQNIAGVRSTLESLFDQKLIDALLERIPSEPDQRLKNNITTLVDRMRMNDEPIDRLKEFAADAAWNNANKRYQAVEVLGQKANPDLIPFLESLGPFDGDNVPNGQSSLFREEANKAIGSIRRRHWKDE
jgi:hypothetical protein